MVTNGMAIDWCKVDKLLRFHRCGKRERMVFELTNAKNVLMSALKHYIEKKQPFEWIDEYDKVAEWLGCNDGKGLFLYGNNGTGKTILCQEVIPAIFYAFHGKVVSTFNFYDLNSNIDAVLSKCILSLDDIGNENEGVVYGNKRWVFPEIMDLAEKKNNIVIVSTNLSQDDIVKKYGIRTAERIISTTVRIEFTHRSLRK